MWPGSVLIEFTFCVAGLLGVLNVVVSGSGYCGLYIGGGFWNAVQINGDFYIILAAVILGDVLLRLAYGAEALRTFSNWSVMIASGASANLMAPWPVSHTALASIDKRLWVVLWMLYQCAEAYVSLFGALDKGVGLIIFTLILRRIIFIFCMAVIAKSTWGSFDRMQKHVGKLTAIPLFMPSQTIGKWTYETVDGNLNINYQMHNLIEPMSESQLLSCMGGGTLLKLHMIGGMAPWPIDPNPIVFCEQMISFGSPTAVIGSRAAIGHILYVAAFVSGLIPSVTKAEDMVAIETDMAKPAADRLHDSKRVNRFTSSEAARILMNEWLNGSRKKAIDMTDSRELPQQLLKAEEDKA
mmetsp:Transcript_14942/g.18436  ORF Transcript_14942/g.18436 Transcript_14942/m.18436 type:complete len:354 (-) Transcript_14942:500-1561(-)